MTFLIHSGRERKGLIAGRKFLDFRQVFELAVTVAERFRVNAEAVKKRKVEVGHRRLFGEAEVASRLESPASAARHQHR